MRIALTQHFVVNRSVRLVASGTAILHAFMDEHEWAGLFAVALNTLLVLAGQAQAAGLFEDFTAMGVVAIHTIHLSLEDRMMLRKAELGMFLLVARQAGVGIGPRVVDENPFSSAGRNVFAARAVTGFAAADAVIGFLVFEEASVDAAGEMLGDLCVTVFTLLVPDKMSSLNLWRDDYLANGGAAR